MALAIKKSLQSKDFLKKAIKKTCKAPKSKHEQVFIVTILITIGRLVFEQTNQFHLS